MPFFPCSRIVLTATVLFLLALVQGCSTGLTPEDCQVADWRLIGFEDGSAGRSMNQVGNHRKACAQVGITPDLEAYRAGHNEGVRQWCNYNSGLSFGESGGNYEGVCPSDLEADFLAGYEQGREVYIARTRVNSLRSSIDSAERKISRLENEGDELEKDIVEEEATAAQRSEYLDRLDDIGEEIAELEVEIVELERDLAEAEVRLESVSY